MRNSCTKSSACAKTFCQDFLHGEVFLYSPRTAAIDSLGSFPEQRSARVGLLTSAYVLAEQKQKHKLHFTPLISFVPPIPDLVALRPSAPYALERHALLTTCSLGGYFGRRYSLFGVGRLEVTGRSRTASVVMLLAAALSQGWARLHCSQFGRAFFICRSWLYKLG